MSYISGFQYVPGVEYQPIVPDLKLLAGAAKTLQQKFEYNYEAMNKLKSVYENIDFMNEEAKTRYDGHINKSKEFYKNNPNLDYTDSKTIKSLQSLYQPLLDDDVLYEKFKDEKAIKNQIKTVNLLQKEGDETYSDRHAAVMYHDIEKYRKAKGDDATKLARSIRYVPNVDIFGLTKRCDDLKPSGYRFDSPGPDGIYSTNEYAGVQSASYENCFKSAILSSDTAKAHLDTEARYELITGDPKKVAQSHLEKFNNDLDLKKQIYSSVIEQNNRKIQAFQLSGQYDEVEKLTNNNLEMTSMISALKPISEKELDENKLRQLIVENNLNDYALHYGKGREYRVQNFEYKSIGGNGKGSKNGSGEDELTPTIGETTIKNTSNPMEIVQTEMNSSKENLEKEFDKYVGVTGAIKNANGVNKKPSEYNFNDDIDMMAMSANEPTMVAYSTYKSDKIVVDSFNEGLIIKRNRAIQNKIKQFRAKGITDFDKIPYDEKDPKYYDNVVLVASNINTSGLFTDPKGKKTALGSIVDIPGNIVDGISNVAKGVKEAVGLSAPLINPIGSSLKLQKDYLRFKNQTWGDFTTKEAVDEISKDYHNKEVFRLNTGAELKKDTYQDLLKRFNKPEDKDFINYLKVNKDRLFDNKGVTKDFIFDNTKDNILLSKYFTSNNGKDIGEKYDALLLPRGSVADKANDNLNINFSEIEKSYKDEINKATGYNITTPKVTYVKKDDIARVLADNKKQQYISPEYLTSLTDYPELGKMEIQVKGKTEKQTAPYEGKIMVIEDGKEVPIKIEDMDPNKTYTIQYTPMNPNKKPSMVVNYFALKDKQHIGVENGEWYAPYVTKDEKGQLVRHGSVIIENQDGSFTLRILKKVGKSFTKSEIPILNSQIGLVATDLKNNPSKYYLNK
jgi:hypothetical protein